MSNATIKLEDVGGEVAFNLTFHGGQPDPENSKSHMVALMLMQHMDTICERRERTPTLVEVVEG